MNRLQDVGIHQLKSAEIFLEKVSDTQLHTGILIKSPDGELWLLHLATHLDLRFEQTQDKHQSKLFCVESIFTETSMKQLAGMARLVWKKNIDGKVPYGFSCPIDVIDSEGTLLLGSDALKYGLTCASFVHALFSSTGIDLLDLPSFPPDCKDTVWQDEIVNLLESIGCLSDDHLRGIRSEVGNFRIRPEYNAAAAKSEAPSKKHEIEGLATELSDKVFGSS